MAELERRPCTRAIVDGSESPEIVLRVILDDALEETRYAMSIGDRTAAHDPEADLNYVSTFEVRWQAEVTVLLSGMLLRGKPSRARAERQPVFRGEDAAAAARSEASLKIAKEARGFLCGRSRKRLQREIEASAGAGSNSR